MMLFCPNGQGMLEFTTKIYRFETNKICNVIFWIKNDPPPFFQKKTSISESTIAPNEVNIFPK